MPDRAEPRRRQHASRLARDPALAGFVRQESGLADTMCDHNARRRMCQFVNADSHKLDLPATGIIVELAVA